MSVLVVGLSHRSAPVSLLEEVSRGLGDGADVLTEVVAGQVSEAVARAALGLSRVMGEEPTTLTAEARAPYLGTYDLGRIRVRIFEQDGHVMAQPTGQRVVRLIYAGDDVFLPDLTGANVRFEFEVVGGRAVTVTVYQGGDVVRARRVE